MKHIFLSAIFFCLLVIANAQNGSPYWSLAGNSNTSSSSKLGTTNGMSLKFFTNNSERARITPSGLMGLGTTSPGARLDVNSSSGQSPLRLQVAGSPKLLVDPSGTVAIGTTVFSTNYKLLLSSGTTDGIYSNGVNYGIKSSATSSSGIGVQGYGPAIGVFGYSNRDGNSRGVNGYAESGFGGFFESYSYTALYAKTYTGFYAATFYGNTWCSGTYYGSDKNIKKNIEDVGSAMSIISKLKPKTYEFKNDGKYASLRLPEGHHYGLLAQDLEQVLPNLVKETPHQLSNEKPVTPSASGDDAKPVDPASIKKETMNIKAVNYTELIPIIIKGLQEQQQSLQLLQQENAMLKDRLSKLENDGGRLTRQAQLTGVSLQQNKPNPFNQTTTFSYTIPADVTAQILIYNAAGSVVKTLAAPATGQVQLNAHVLAPGTYVYSLMVNGKVADSKKMLLSK